MLGLLVSAISAVILAVAFGATSSQLQVTLKDQYSETIAGWQTVAFICHDGKILAGWAQSAMIMTGPNAPCPANAQNFAVVTWDHPEYIYIGLGLVVISCIAQAITLDMPTEKVETPPFAGAREYLKDENGLTVGMIG
jgi:hypothetical protein